MPTESTNTEDDVQAAPTGIPSSNLDADFLCDLDGSRLEVHGRNTVADTTYEVRVCSSNPNHSKQIPL